MERKAHQTSREPVDGIIRMVEQTFGKRPTTPKDFDLLKSSIYRRTGTMLSATTLKRIWGYLAEGVSPRKFTLDTLCRYAGWKDKTALDLSLVTEESGPLILERLDIDDRLLSDDLKIIISWSPDREITISYLGGNRFIINNAKNTRLQIGDIFQTGIIAKDQPLYLDPLIRNDSDLGVYVCGKETGIRFVICSEKD